MPKYLPERYQNPLLRTDEGYQETEELLYDMIKDIKGVYGTAYKEMLAKSKKYLEWFVAADNAKRKLYEEKKISEEDYKNWRRTYMFQGRQTYGMLDTMAADLTNTNNIAASIINGYIPEVYAINGNYISYKCCKDLDMNIAFTLYDEQTVERLIREKPDLLPKAKVNIPKDLQWNKQHLTSAITQGILQGETVNQIAERLAKVTDMNENSAIRNARTMTTSAQNGGRQDGAERAQAMGIELEKMWLSCLDGRTRDSHRELDGEKKAVESKFSNGLMYPADPHGAAGEVYNCRCTYTTVVKGAKVNPANMSERYSKLGDMSYEEWKKGRQKEQNSGSNDSKNATKALSEPKIHNLSLDNKAENGIIKSITIDDFKISDTNNVVSSDCKEAIINTLKKQGSLYDYDEIKVVNIPPDKDKRIEPLRTNAIETPYYPNVVLEVNEVAFAGRTKEQVDLMFKSQHYCVADNLEEAVVHECAHAKVIEGKTYRQYKEIDEELSGSAFTSPIKSRDDKKSLQELAGGISEYAQKDGLECIAETHVLLDRGETIEPDLKALHDKYI